MPTRLRFEHLDDHVLGTLETEPRLSWELPDGATAQHAYQLIVGDWDSGRVESSQPLFAPAQVTLQSRTKYGWRVRVWTDLGLSGWSRPADFETGLLSADDWTARFVTPREDQLPPPGRRPVHVLRSSFSLATLPSTARVYATAHGVYEAFLNGTRIGDAELTPGWTAYHVNLQVQTYDVTSLLRPGTNAVEVRLSDGWFRGQLGYGRHHDSFGTELALLLQLEVDHDVVLATDAAWTSCSSRSTADLIQGETADLREHETGPWRPVSLADHDMGRLVSSPAPPVRRLAEIGAVAVTKPTATVHVVDLGQNINGWVRLGRLGPVGTTVTLTYGERLDPQGDVTQAHLEPTVPGTTTFRPLGQVDEVVSSGDDTVWEPRHSTKGFRYVRVTGLTRDLAPQEVSGVVVHTDLRRTGWFHCSDDRLNRLHDAALWSFRGNACDIPTDCPQRERDGWTGDWQLYFPTAAFLYDVAGFSAKWLRDLRADQWPDGRVPNIVPNNRGNQGKDDPVQAYLTGSAGWGDAAVIVPWLMYELYGDRRALEVGFDTMTRWVDWCALQAAQGRAAGRTGTPAPHEKWLWDTGFHFGEWTEPGEDRDALFRGTVDNSAVATAFLHRSASLVSRIARLLDRDGSRFEEIATGALAAWRAEFIGADGRLRPDTQATHVRALEVGLVPPELRQRTADRLAELVREAGNHVGTGFLATPMLLPVLADNGHVDVAYDLLLQDSFPSWLFMIDQGATTIWESWEPVVDGSPQERGEPLSLNHYSKGAVVSFLHRYVAGLRPSGVAWREVTVQPRPGGGLTSAEAAFDSPYGRVSSSWTVRDHRLLLDVAVAAGTSATVLLPDGTSHRQGPGAASYTCSVT